MNGPIILLGCATLALLAARQPAYPQTARPLPPYETVVDQFVDVAFGHEHGRSRSIVQKWSTAPTIGFFAQSQADVTPHVERILQVVSEIDQLTGLAIETSDPRKLVTLRFGFYPRAAFAKLPIPQDTDETRRFVRESACVGMVVTDPGHEGDITTGAIVIGTDISGTVQYHCILEELVQVLGLPNDACRYRPSLFCDEDMVDDMTPADKILLRALYDRRLAAGIRQEEAMPMVRKLISELYPEQRGGGNGR